jgi:hypothetical protein
MLGPDSVAPMQHSAFEFQGPVDESKPEVAWPGTPEERVDRFGFRTALLVLVLALFVAAMWVANRVLRSAARWRALASAMLVMRS